MFGKNRQIETDELVLRLVRGAGYRAPTLLQQKAIPLSMQGRDLVVETEPGKGRTGAFIIPLLLQTDRERDGVQAVVLTPSVAEVRKVADQFKKFSSRAPHKPFVISIGNESNAKKDLRALAKKPDIIIGTSERIIDHLRRNNITLDTISVAVLDIPGEITESGFDKDVEFIYSKMPSRLQTIVYAANLDGIAALGPVLKRPQQLTRSEWQDAGDDSTASTKHEEKPSVTEKEFVPKDDRDELRSAVSEMIRHIKQVENPDVLGFYKKTYKKNVPFHLRGYAAAYLLKEYLAREGVQASRLQTMFVSAGKNRKVYPRDLTRLFADALRMDPSLIGSIKVLDNYSFVELPGDQAEKAIELLNDTEYRGRKLTVNYARKKRKKG